MQEPSQIPTNPLPPPRPGTRDGRRVRRNWGGASGTDGEGRRRTVGLREWLLALLAALVVAAVATWPLVGELGRSLPHDPRFTSPEGSDVHLFVWDLWWVSDALERGHPPFHTDAIFAPVGHSLALHTHVFLWGLLATPIERLFGAAAAYGAVLLALLATSAAACYGLGRFLGLGRCGAAFAAAAWAFSPYFLQKGLEHLNLTANPLVPLLVWAALVWRGGGARANWAALATGGLWGACLLVDAMAALWTALLVALVWLLAPASRVEGDTSSVGSPAPSRRGLRSPVAFALAVVAALLVGGPYVAELGRELRSLERHRQQSETGAGLARDQLYHPELLDFVTPSGLHPLARTDGAPALGAARVRPDAHHPDRRAEHAGLAAPFAALLLVALGAWRVPPSRRWLAVGLCFWLLAWDPGPDPEGWLSGLYRRVPGLDMLRVPARAWPYAWLCLSLVAGAGAAVLARGGRGGKFALGGAGLLLAFELCAAPYPMAPWRVPQAVAALAPATSEEREAARAGGHLLQLPFEPGAGPALSWQTVHERPLVFGYLARIHPAAPERLLRLAPGLFAHALGAPLADPEDLTLELDLLGVEHILVDLRRTQDPERALWVLDRLTAFERRPEGEDGRGGPGPDGVLAWSRRRPAAAFLPPH
ncbi:MAG: hypothetical protein GC161_00570 [Planctomycetaceae bacterium]|nr:hypothetical protein [Planctomycetaceae bacterium]